MPKKKDKPTVPLRGVCLGIDPGVHNTAWCLYSVNGIENHGVEDGVGKKLELLTGYGARMRRLIHRYDPEAMVIERYTVRPSKKFSFTGHVEPVNIMIGMLIYIAEDNGIPYKLVTASTHKTWAKKNFGATKKGGRLCMHTVAEYKCLATEHEADAANMAKYGYLKAFAQEIE